LNVDLRQWSYGPGHMIISSTKFGILRLSVFELSSDANAGNTTHDVDHVHRSR